MRKTVCLEHFGKAIHAHRLKNILINDNIKANVTMNNCSMRCMNKLRISARIHLLTPFKEFYAEIVMT